MQFQLISANGLIYDELVYEVLAPTQAGTIAVYKDHMPLISAGAPGVLSVRKHAGDADSQLEHFAVYGGVIQIDGTSTRFVTDDVTMSHEVSEEEAKKALTRAEELIAGAKSREALHEAKQMIHHHTVRLHLAQLKSRHHR